MIWNKICIKLNGAFWTTQSVGTNIICYIERKTYNGSKILPQNTINFDVSYVQGTIDAHLL